MDYDEQSVLTDYICRHCISQMTELERLGMKAVLAHEKAAATDDDLMRRMLLQKFGAEGDPRVAEALSQGHEAFRIAVRDRVVRDTPEIIARCPKCGRILRSPKARQCRWCHHNWHAGA